MDNTSSWQNFCMLYYDQAMASAKYHLNKIKGSFHHWDERIDEDVICVDAVMEALQKAFVKFDPSRGSSLTTFLSRIVHNELVNELERETKSLSAQSNISTHQEAEYTFRNIVSAIPESTMDGLKVRLRSAILKLSPIDQSILGFFLEDPESFVSKSVESLGVTPGFVSVHKNRALAKLPSLMGMTANDYFDLYEDHTFAGVKAKKTQKSDSVHYVNLIWPQFNLEGTVLKLFDAINSSLPENV